MNKLRKWINRDDGKYHRVGNDSLNYLEVLGGVLMICSFLLMVFKQKTDLSIPKWGIVTTLIVSVGLFSIGNWKKGNDKV